QLARTYQFIPQPKDGDLVADPLDDAVAVRIRLTPDTRNEIDYERFDFLRVRVNGSTEESCEVTKHDEARLALCDVFSEPPKSRLVKMPQATDVVCDSDPHTFDFIR